MAESDKHSFWQTLPGILTALAAVITALTGLVVGMRQVGVFSRPAGSPAAVGSPVAGSGSAAAGPVGADRALGASPTSSGGEASGLPEEINLLATDNGGQVVVANGGDDWRRTILGGHNLKEVAADQPGNQPEAVYAFRNNATAQFDRFRVYKSTNDPSDIKTFELLVGNDSPTGVFQSIGTFTMPSVVYVGNPYQEFRFAPVKGRYLKVKLLMRQDGYEDNFEIWEFQLMGRLD